LSSFTEPHFERYTRLKSREIKIELLKAYKGGRIPLPITCCWRDNTSVSVYRQSLGASPLGSQPFSWVVQKPKGSGVHRPLRKRHRTWCHPHSALLLPLVLPYNRSQIGANHLTAHAGSWLGLLPPFSLLQSLRIS